MQRKFLICPLAEEQFNPRLQHSPSATGSTLQAQVPVWGDQRAGHGYVRTFASFLWRQKWRHKTQQEDVFLMGYAGSPQRGFLPTPCQGKKLAGKKLQKQEQQVSVCNWIVQTQQTALGPAP